MVVVEWNQVKPGAIPLYTLRQRVALSQSGPSAGKMTSDSPFMDGSFMSQLPTLEPTGAPQGVRFSLTRLSAIATALVAAAAYALVGRTAAQGVLLGGIAGIAGLWMMASRLRQTATIAPEKLHLTMILGTYARLPVYGVFLYLGYRMDPETLHGLFGALAGLMAVRYVPIYFALARARAERRNAGNTPGQS